MSALMKIASMGVLAAVAGTAAIADDYSYDLTPLPIENAIALPSIVSPLENMPSLMDGFAEAGAMPSQPIILSADAFREASRFDALDSWQHQFTLRSLDASPLSQPVDRFEFVAGSKWGFTLGFDNDRASLFDPEQVSAGAYYRLSPRIRIGGELNFIESEESRVLDATPVGEDNAELKLESAFRF